VKSARAQFKKVFGFFLQKEAFSFFFDGTRAGPGGRMHLFLQILIDGFAISALYALGATGFTLMFGVSGVLNLSHGAIMVVAAVVGWLVAGNSAAGALGGTLLGILAGLLAAYATYFVVVRPIQRSKAIAADETEIFLLTGTLIWGIMIQSGLNYLFTDNPVAMEPLIHGVTPIAGVRTPTNEIMISVICWVVIGLLWLLVNRTRMGKALLAAASNPRGLTMLGFELSNIYLLVWTIYGVLAGLAGVLLATFLGTSPANTGTLTASAFSIVVLGGLGSVSGSLIAAYVVGYLETLTAYLVAPTLRPIPALLLLVIVVYLRPQGLLGRR
jgi:branched-chain amino acid transport system permease protein